MDEMPAHAEVRLRPDRLIWSLVILLAALRIAATWSFPGPTIMADEAGYLGSARLLSGNGAVWPMGAAAAYQPGYSLLLAPLFWFGDPAVVYRLAVVLNAFLASSIVAATFSMVRTFVDLRSARTIAIVSGALPAMTALVPFLWSEAALMAAVAWAGASAVWLVEPLRRSVVSRFGFGLLVAASYLLHGRGLALVAAGLVFLAVVWWRRPELRRVAELNTSFIVVGVAVANYGASRFRSARWAPGNASTSGAVADRLKDPSEWLGAGASMVAQTWTLTVGTFGLTVVAVVLLGRVIRRDDRSLALVYLVLSWLFLIGLAGFFWGDPAEVKRADAVVYGRYVEPLAPSFVAVAGIGLARFGEGIRSRVLLAVGAWAVAAVCIGAVMWHAGREVFERPVSLFNISTLGAVMDRWPERTIEFGLVVLVVGVMLATQLGAGARRGVAASFGLVALGGALGVAALTTTHRHAVFANGHREFADQVEEFESSEVQFFGPASASRWGLPFWAPDTTFVWSNGFPSGVATDLVIAPPDHEAAGQLFDAGARMVASDVFRQQALFVLPGPRLDELLAEGAVLPNPIRGELPPDARIGLLVADLEISSTEVTGSVNVFHGGGAAIWPDDDVIPDWRVMVVVDLENGAESSRLAVVELDEPVAPGEEQTVDVDLDLPAGAEGTVVVRLTQGVTEPDFGPAAVARFEIGAS